MVTSIFLAAGEAAGAAKDQGLYQTFVMIGVAVVFFYFILWRPEQKRRKKMESMRKGLKKGDRIIAMGICAVVEEVREKTVVVKIDGARMEMLHGAISEVQSEEAAVVQK